MEIVKNNHSPLYNIGSCGLHSIHGAFETGMISCGWEINKIMKSMHKLFDKFPARRDLFISINSLNTFPKRFVMPFTIFYGQAMNSCYITIIEWWQTMALYIFVDYENRLVYRLKFTSTRHFPIRHLTV